MPHKIFQTLQDCARNAKNRSIEALFEETDRVDQFSVEAVGLFFDASKSNMSASERILLQEYASLMQVEQQRKRLYAGETVNHTEGRAALHMALRADANAPYAIDGHNVMPEVLATRAKMASLTREFWQSDIQDVINIGIGGSHLGPAMVTRALRHVHKGPHAHFLSNLDASDARDILDQCDPKKTLVIVVSKSFTTQETLVNAELVKTWMLAGGGDPRAQFIAVASDLKKTQAFGVDPDKVLGFGDWVGGRYSVWGPVGLSVMMAIGPECFEQFLQGAAQMDHHFQTAPLSENLPIFSALVALWHGQFMHYPTRSIAPYAARLQLLVPYLQQLEMESNGKGHSVDGMPIDGSSVPVVWGGPGTNGQHAYFQALHQGTQVIPCEFLLPAQPTLREDTEQHQLVLANALAQSEVLMKGRKHSDPHRIMPGNRPSTTLIFDALSPSTLGKLIAYYEHRTFTEAVLLGVNPFDQWGVELGKMRAADLVPYVRKENSSTGLQASTKRVLTEIFKRQI